MGWLRVPTFDRLEKIFYKYILLYINKITRYLKEKISRKNTKPPFFPQNDSILE